MLKLGVVSTIFDCFPDRLKPTSTKLKAPPMRSQFPPKQPNRGSVSQRMKRMPAAAKHLQLPQMPVITLLSGYI